MRRRHRFTYVCNKIVTYLNTSHDSHAYKRIDLTLLLKIRSLVIILSLVVSQTGFKVVKAARAVFSRFLISTSTPLSVVITVSLKGSFPTLITFFFLQV
jgi:hypothetical protein